MKNFGTPPVNSGIADEIRSMAESRGFEMPKPDRVPDLPPDVTTVSGSELMKLMTKFTVMISYAATEEAEAKARAEAMASRYKEERARKYVVYKGDESLTEKQRDYMLDADDDLVPYKKEEVLASGYAGMVKAVLKGLEAKYQLLSRELTRRGLATERSFD